MATQPFPHDYYLDTMVRLLDTIEYGDDNYTREDRIECLRYSYHEAAKHFSKPIVYDTLKVSTKRLEAALRTIVGMVVYSWSRCSKEVHAALSIHYTYTLLLDDSTDDPFPQMETFFQDMVNGNEQKHAWWRLVNAHLPNVLQHYGPYCSLNIWRSAVDFFQGCWIEQYNFHGYAGSHDYPQFLRRMNGLGHAVGASIFPSEQFDEKKLFLEITTAIAQMENWMVWVNDMMSFYKEFDDPRDQTSLVNNYCHCEGITLNESLEKLTKDTIHSSEQLVEVFKDKDANMKATLAEFMQGYVTWHLCDKRYRLSEIYERTGAGESEAADKFREYCGKARAVGAIDPAEWAVPSVTQMLALRTPPEEEVEIPQIKPLELVGSAESVESDVQPSMPPDFTPLVLTPAPLVPSKRGSCELSS